MNTTRHTSVSRDYSAYATDHDEPSFEPRRVRCLSAKGRHRNCETRQHPRHTAPRRPATDVRWMNSRLAEEGIAR